MVSDRRSRHARRKAENSVWPGGRCSQVAEGTQIMGARVDCSLERGHTGDHYACDHGVFWSQGASSLTLTGEQMRIGSHIGTTAWIRNPQMGGGEPYTWNGDYWATERLSVDNPPLNPIVDYSYSMRSRPATSEYLKTVMEIFKS